MVHHTKYTKYREELPIGAARRAIIMDWLSWLPKALVAIIADYAQITAMDKVDILCPGESGSLQVEYDIYHRSYCGGIQLKWITHRSNGASRWFQLSSWNRTEFTSKFFKIGSIVWIYENDRESTYLLENIPQLKKFFGDNQRSFQLFFDSFNAMLAKIL